MPVGTLCTAVVLPGPDGEPVTHTRTTRLPGVRDQMRQMSVITSLDQLRRVLVTVS